MIFLIFPMAAIIESPNIYICELHYAFELYLAHSISFISFTQFSPKIKVLYNSQI